jgi:hypothetical protein
MALKMDHEVVSARHLAISIEQEVGFVATSQISSAIDAIVIFALCVAPQNKKKSHQRKSPSA